MHLKLAACVCDAWDGLLREPDYVLDVDGGSVCCVCQPRLARLRQVQWRKFRKSERRTGSPACDATPRASALRLGRLLAATLAEPAIKADPILVIRLQFLSGLAVTLITLAASWCSLLLGTHLHAAAPNILTRLTPTTHAHPRPLLRLTCLALGPAFYLGVILLVALGPHSWRHDVTFALLLGPPGTLLRFELARRLNPLNPRLPLGTLAANALAVLVFAVTALLQRGEALAGDRCGVLKGVQDGFCGSLSTVSTFVVELRTLGRREGWGYFAVSWAVGQALFVVVLGSWVWSGDRGGTCSA